MGCEAKFRKDLGLPRLVLLLEAGVDLVQLRRPHLLLLVKAGVRLFQRREPSLGLFGTRYGEYDALPSVYRAVFEWCAENGHAPAGVNWEVYGDWHDDPVKRRTDVYCLVAPGK